MSGSAPPRGEEHGALDELAVGWALHALEPEEETLFAAHLPGCSRCRGTVAETGEVLAALAGALPAAVPSDRLREALRAAAGDTMQVPGRPAPGAGVPDGASPGGASPGGDTGRPGPETVPTGFPEPFVPVAGRPAVPPTAWRRVLPNALVATAVAAILALGTWNVVLSTARDEARATVARQADVVNALLTPGRATVVPLSGDDGAPVATVVTRNGEVQVVNHGLPVNDPGEVTYVLWGTSDGAAVALGTFDVVSPRMDLQAVGSAATGLDEHDGYGISLEPGRLAPSAPTDIVARGEVTN
ncbi:anti-sigma factor domain-containing protein [Geodermatophilus sabuli]|uniref:Regulator of SigK n=1 Tax=Geodermatophilus sabuli TaxID=1564158 RepID=A0A285EAR2_9ACTN|nr:anti-sigma factor [Geodermatophilus sabuli]MBB3081977.1 anti-sigma factor RsiW [Geodermatophilus sabuli]SNX95151.1 Anti-sigma-K factor rskA [Geodermatophilus sabuli]